MKKSFGFFLIINVMVFSITCGQTETTIVQNQVKGEESVSSADNPFAVVEEVKNWFDFKPDILNEYPNPIFIKSLQQLDSIKNNGGLEKIVALQMNFYMIFKNGKPADFSFFKHLKNLEYFRVSGLEEIPKELYELKELRAFSLFGLRKFQEGFTDDLANLRKLELLDLYYANIKLPAAISKLSQLKTLKTYKGVPEQPYSSIYKLPNLTSLWISYTDSIELAGISNLKKLKSLATNMVAEEVGALTELTSLMIHNSSAKHFPIALNNLEKLVALQLEDCLKIESAPAFVSSLTNLEFMEIRDCPKLIHIPANYGELRKLRHFNILFNKKYTELESNLSTLKHVIEIKNY